MTTTKVQDQSAAVSAMAPRWDLVDALAGGTEAMRAAGRQYLPQRPMEKREDFDARLAAATLFPAYSEAIKSMVGRVFAEPLVPGDDIPDWIRKEVLDDVDLQGRNLHAWAREWFGQAMHYGHMHVLVDSPAVAVTTQAEQKAAKVRPYLVAIKPRRVLGWREANGELTQVRIAFTREEDDGDFGTRVVEQIRVYEPGRVRTYEKQQQSTVTGAENWLQVEDRALGLGVIPLVTLYTNRTGMMTSKPPLLELGHLNVKHWQVQSSIDSLVDTAMVPILAVSGAQEGDKIAIGAKHAVNLPQGGTLEYVEHTGAAIGAGRAELEALEQQMDVAGGKLLEPRAQSAAKTATQSTEDAAVQNSELGAMAGDLQDTLAAVLDMVALWRSEDDGGSVEVRPNLAPDPMPNETVNTLLALRDGGIVSDQTVFEGAQERGLVPEHVSWEEEQARMREQGPPPEGRMPPMPPEQQPGAPA